MSIGIPCQVTGGRTMAKGKMSEDEKRWQAEDDIRVMSRAKELEAELAKDPERKERKKRMVEMAKSRMTEMASIASEGKE